MFPVCLLYSLSYSNCNEIVIFNVLFYLHGHTTVEDVAVEAVAALIIVLRVISSALWVVFTLVASDVLLGVEVLGSVHTHALDGYRQLTQFPEVNGVPHLHDKLHLVVQCTYDQPYVCRCGCTLGSNTFLDVLQRHRAPPDGMCIILTVVLTALYPVL